MKVKQTHYGRSLINYRNHNGCKVLGNDVLKEAGRGQHLLGVRAAPQESPQTRQTHRGPDQGTRVHCGRPGTGDPAAGSQDRRPQGGAVQPDQEHRGQGQLTAGSGRDLREECGQGEEVHVPDRLPHEEDRGVQAGFAQEDKGDRVAEEGHQSRRERNDHSPNNHKTLPTVFPTQQLNLINQQKTKYLQALTKKQIKLNQVSQNITQLKLKKAEAPNVKNAKPEDTKKEEKQINDLFNAIKKQFALIDILKRQKMHLIASTVFKYSEDEFSRVLDMKRNS